MGLATMIKEPNIPGWFTVNQLNFLYTTVLFAEAKHALEIGTYMGRSSFAICEALAALDQKLAFDSNSHNSTELKRSLKCIDTFASPIDSEYYKAPFMETMLKRYSDEIISKYTNFRELPTTLDCFNFTINRFPEMRKYITIAKMNSRDLDLADNYYCFALIDGDHTYEGVSHDFETVWPNIRSGGVVFFDDYSSSFPDVVKFVNDVLTLPNVICIGKVDAGIAILKLS